MKHSHRRTVATASLAAAALAALTLSGCNDGGTTVPNPPAPQEATFSIFVNTLFGQSANSTPVDVTNVTFNFDVNDDPTAFNGLLAEGTYY